VFRFQHTNAKKHGAPSCSPAGEAGNLYKQPH